MKIAISGAQCTGKTTLVEALKADKSFEDYLFLDNIIKKLVDERGIKINEQFDITSQKLIMHTHVNNLLKNKKFITDRCVLDAYVYAFHGYMKKEFRAHEILYFAEILNKSLKLYDYIFYLPMEFDLVDAKEYRSPDKDFRTNIAYIFDLIIERKKPDNLYRIEGTVQERINTIKTILKI